MMQIKQSYETETFTSAAGYYVIKQECEFVERIALLTPEQMRLLIVDMEEHLKDLSWSKPEEVEQ